MAGGCHAWAGLGWVWSPSPPGFLVGRWAPRVFIHKRTQRAETHTHTHGGLPALPGGCHAWASLGWVWSPSPLGFSGGRVGRQGFTHKTTQRADTHTRTHTHTHWGVACVGGGLPRIGRSGLGVVPLPPRVFWWAGGPQGFYAHTRTDTAAFRLLSYSSSLSLLYIYRISSRGRGAWLKGAAAARCPFLLFLLRGRRRRFLFSKMPNGFFVFLRPDIYVCIYISGMLTRSCLLFFTRKNTSNEGSLVSIPEEVFLSMYMHIHIYTRTHSTHSLALRSHMDGA